jgi:ribosomal protein S12 methylthiotransferase accessory factor
MTGTASERAQSALDAYRAALKPAVDNGNVYEFPLTPIDRLGLPLWTVALIPQDGALCDGFGYGPSLTAAQASAWGETIEWYFAREALKHMPRRVASYHELVADGNDAVDPITLCLSAGSDYTHDYRLTWVAGRRHPSGDQVWVPIEAVAPRYADIGAHVDPKRFLLTPITNGLGAGPSFEHALAHGILELIQRDGNSVNYRALDRGIAIALDDVRDEETRSLLSSLAAQGVDVIVKLATTDFGMANVYL